MFPHACTHACGAAAVPRAVLVRQVPADERSRSPLSCPASRAREGQQSALSPVQTARGSTTWKTDMSALRMNDPGLLCPAPPHPGCWGCECGDTGRTDGRAGGSSGSGRCLLPQNVNFRQEREGGCSQPLAPRFPHCRRPLRGGHRDSDTPSPP